MGGPRNRDDLDGVHIVKEQTIVRPNGSRLVMKNCNIQNKPRNKDWRQFAFGYERNFVQKQKEILETFSFDCLED